MIGAHRRQDASGSSFSSTCTSASANTRWSDTSGSPLSPVLLSPQRPTFRAIQRSIFPIVPAAWSPISLNSPRAALRDLCLPRQEPRPPADVLKRSNLGSCSPSLARFSRTSTSQHVSISTSTTTLPSMVVQANAFRHPTMAYLTVNGHRHHRNSR